MSHSIHESASRVYMTFGTHNGKTLAKLARDHRSYLEWLAGQYMKDKSSLPIAAAMVLEGKDIDGLHLQNSPFTTTSTTQTPSAEIKVTIWRIDDTKIGVQFPYNPAFLERFKAEIDGRKWRPADSIWTIPSTKLPELVALVGGPKNMAADEGAKALYRAEVKRRSDLDIIRTKTDTEFYEEKVIGKVINWDDVALIKTVVELVR